MGDLVWADGWVKKNRGKNQQELQFEQTRKNGKKMKENKTNPQKSVCIYAFGSSKRSVKLFDFDASKHDVEEL